MFLLLALARAEDPAPADDKPKWDVREPHGPGVDVNFTVSEGTWLGLDVSPDGKTVLFDLLGDLYTVPLAGGATSRLTQGVDWDTDAHWSNDGKRIGWTTDRNGNDELWVMNADGTNPKQLTDEKVDRWSDLVWAPEDGWFVGRKRMTDTRSIGVQELWLKHEQGGAGTQLTNLAEDPHAGEAAFSKDGRYVYFSTRAKRFDYDDNPHAGLWQIVRYDRVRNERLVITDLAGGAARPTPSPDGKSLAFITRDKVSTVLMTMDLQSGKVARLADWLEFDQMEGFELHGTYPRMDWTPDGKELVFWAGGKLWRFDVASRQRTMIPFAAHVETRVTDSVHPPRRVADGPVHARVIRWAVEAKDGTVYAAALGRIWAIGKDGAARAVTPESQTAYFPTLSADEKQLAYVTWSDAGGGQVWAGPIGAPKQITKTAADYQAPAFSPNGKQLLFLRGSGATARGHDLGSEAYQDVRVAFLDQPGDGIRVKALPFRGTGNRAPRMQFSHDGQRILWLQDQPGEDRKPETAALLSASLTGEDERTEITFPAGAQEVRVSPDGNWFAYKSEHEAWVAPMPPVEKHGVSVADVPTRKLTDTAGDWVDWHGDNVTWMQGDTMFSVAAPGVLDKDAKAIPSAIQRPISIEVPRFTGQGTIVFTNARVLTMDDAGVIDRTTVIVKDRRILAMGPNVLPPDGATVYDLHGQTILPGIVDVHAHLHYASGDVFPEQEWRHLTNLAYGVTTVFDPSAATDLVFGQAEQIEAGRMAGPRTLSTGFILYGALDTQGAKIETYEDAENHVRRLLRVGAWGVKSYQQPRREQRQWIVEACRKLGMLDVPEGGGDFFGNMGMILDGHSSIEHSIPMTPLYQDVQTLWSKAKTTYTPTLIVAYGGAFGEWEKYQSERVWEDQRLSKFTPPEVLMSRAYRLTPYITDAREFHHRAVAVEAAKLKRLGVNVTLGAHGQLQGLGDHWELELLGGPGAMTPYEAIWSATMAGAKHLGLDQDIGSIREGKVADLFVVSGDPLTDLKDARNVVYVMKDGVLYDAAGNMDRLSPQPQKRGKLIWEAAGR